MGCILTYFKLLAHNAGISPSSTQESNSKQPASEDGGRPVQEERSIAEEPESNDTSYGVEATAVRTLAATTGTVAILGTTAKTGDKKDGSSDDSPVPVVVETIPEEQEEPAVSVEQVVIHKEEQVETNQIVTKEAENSSSPSSRPVSGQLEDSGKRNEEHDDARKSPSPSVSNETKAENPPSASPVAPKSPLSETNNSEVSSPEVKSPLLPVPESEPKNAEENTSEPLISESTKEKEDDVSKSISSERLKTNSISNTTLSSDSIAEFDNNSVKQSPSADKVIESFDSSSTVEFVDLTTKDSNKGEDNKTNPARSISSDLSNKANLPVDGEKTPDLTSPVESDVAVDTHGVLLSSTLESEKSSEVVRQISETSTKVADTEILNSPEVTQPSHVIKEELVTQPSPVIQEELVKQPSAITEEDLVKQPPSVSEEELVRQPSAVSQEQLVTQPGDVSQKELVTQPSAITEEELVKQPSSVSEEELVRQPSAASQEELLTTPNSTPKEQVISDEISVNSEVSSNVSSSVQSVIRHDANVQEVNSKSAVDSSSTNASDDNKAETGSPFSSDNNSSFNDNGEVTSPVTAVILSPAPVSTEESQREEIKLENTSSLSTEQVHEQVNGISEETEGASVNKLPSIESTSKTNVSEEQISLESTNAKASEPTVNGEVADDVFGSPTNEEVVSAATTIQASFRGYQARQNLKESEKKENEPKATVETLVIDSKDANTAIEETTLNSVSEVLDSKIDDTDDKEVAAATTIQANFRGFQTRQKMKSKLDSGLEASEEMTQSAESKTPTALTPELIESVREEVDDICKEAETIVAERSESADEMLKGVMQVVVGAKESALPSVSESVQAVRGSATPPSVSDADDTKEEVFDSLPDEKAVNAATTIQASFRGFQTRRALQDTNQEQLDDQGLEVSDDEVWGVLKNEMSDAATRIQSNFRGYRTRKQLQREDAVQVTSSSSQATPSSGSVEVVSRGSAEPTTRTSGEYHDMIALTPPNLQGGGALAPAAAVADQPADDADMVKRRAEDDGKEEAAATKIQATFRGFKSRQQMRDVDRAAAKIQAGFRGYKVRKEMKKSDIVRSSSNPEVGGKGTAEETAATKIQAGVRGFLVRRRYQKEQEAATKIQAGFRGFQSRKQ